MTRRALKRAALILLLLFSLPATVFSEQAANAERDREAAALAAASKQYILLKKGQFEIENAITYSHYSANQIYLQSFAILDPVFLTLGQFGIQSSKRDIFIYNLGGRYGIRDNLRARRQPAVRLQARPSHDFAGVGRQRAAGQHARQIFSWRYLSGLELSAHLRDGQQAGRDLHYRV